jgi:Flp pilus assembly protein TadG
LIWAHSATWSDQDRGSITLWLLGLSIAVLFLGGLSLDLWRAFNERRLVAGIVDAAAIAGASGIDEPLLRATGEVRLDPAAAEGRALANLASHSATVDAAVTVAADGSAITVTGSREVPLTLLGVLLPDQGPLTFEVSATSRPQRGP